MIHRRLNCLGLLFVFCLFLSACDGEKNGSGEIAAADKHSISEVELEQVCANLNTNEQVYTAIVGRYLGSKSETMLPPSNSSSKSFSHKMFFENDGMPEIAVYTGSDISSINEYFLNLETILGKDVVENNKDTDLQYGICALKNNENNLVGIFNTFTRVEE